jgi:hypothetical protein
VRRLGRHPDVELVAPTVPRGDDAAGLHRHREVAVLDERLGDDVRRRGEDLLELVVGRQQELAGEIAVTERAVHELRIRDRRVVVDDRR